ncbi:MAG: DUF6678 family protein [Oscillospiraceae bacterium]
MNIYEDRKKLLKYLEENNLTSYMNDTKWNKFVNAMNDEMPFQPPYDIKYLEQPSEDYLINAIKNQTIYHEDYYDDETFTPYYYKFIEWVKIYPRYWEKVGGQLIYKKILHDCEKELIQVLEKYHIPFEYDNKNGIYTIYGYK